MNAPATPLIYKATRTVTGSPEAAFALVSDHTGLARWVPFVRHVELDRSGAEVRNGVGTLRVVNPGRRPVRETVVAFEPPHMLAYQARDEDLFGLITQHESRIDCQALGKDRTRVTWAVYGVRGRAPLGWLARPVMARVVNGGLRKLGQLLSAGA